jgi:hypothetical protein
LRRILPDNISSGEVAELSSEMIDEMMDEGANDDDDDANTGEYDFDMDDASQAGGDGSVDSAEEEASATKESAEESLPEPNDEILATPTLPPPTQTHQTLLPQMAPSPQTFMSSMPTNQPDLSHQPNLSNQPDLSNPNNPINPAGTNMEVSLTPMSGGGDDSQVEELSKYGGVKPDFDVMEREDDTAIENLNAQLLGIQTGGQNESLEKAKQQGIASVMSSNPQEAIQQQNQVNATQQTPQTPQTQFNSRSGSSGDGLNFSFGQQQPVQTPSYRQQLSMPMQMPMPMQIPMPNQQSAGGVPQKQVSFNNDIKVVELDTKISEGFLYSGSKNLDPFGQ